MIRRCVVLLVLTGFFAAAASAAGVGAEEARALSEKGVALLQKGEFEKALSAFARAAKAEPENKAYMDTAMLVKRVISLRRFVAGSKPSEKWADVALSLHSFYLANGILGEALVLDRKVHGSMKNLRSATVLSETLLAMNRNEEAIEVLTGLGETPLDVQAMLYLGIALGRQKRVEEAKEIAGHCRVPLASPWGVLYDCSRLHSLLGEKETSLAYLKLCFESTPPSRLDAVKGAAKKERDFDSLKEGKEFAGVMKTASKVTESACSGGTSCGSCPSRTKCGGEEAKNTEKKAAGTGK
jgi:tetratricopeptide (TPR) repeat protein